MRRLIASFAIFAGWLSIPAGAMLGMIESQFLGLNQVDGPSPLTSVYGTSAAIVLWIFVAAAIMASVPMAMAMFAVRPHRRLYAIAAAMAVAFVLLLPDELGRSFGVPLLIGAAFVAYGARQLQLEPIAEAGAFSGAPLPLADSAEPATTQAPATPPASSAAAAPATPTPAPAAAAKPRKSRKKPVSAGELSCPWCSAPIPAAATICPSCHASLGGPGVETLSIPGVTEVQPELRAYALGATQGKKRTSLLKTIFSDTSIPQAIGGPEPSSEAALLPPSPELKAEMARIDAEIAAGRLLATAESADDDPTVDATDAPGSAPRT